MTLTYIQWSALTPFLFPLLGALVIPLMVLTRTTRNEKLVRWTMWLVTLWVLYAAIKSLLQLWIGGHQPSYGPLLVDRLTQFGSLVVLGSAGLSVLQLWDHLHHEGWFKGETLALFLFSVAGLMIFMASTHLLVLFLALELFSLPLYVLTGSIRVRTEGAEGGLKYFISGAVASSCLLLGIVLLFGLTGSLDLMEISQFAHQHGWSDSLMLLGLGLILFGVLFKMSAVPMHQWTPDVYQAAPHPISGFMSVATKTAAFIVFIRIFIWGFLNDSQTTSFNLQPLLSIIGILTLFVGNLTALAQHNIKRMLAFSSIAHAGYLLLAFVSGTEQSLQYVFYYLVIYGFTNAGLFGILTAFGWVGAQTDFDHARGQGWKRPFLGMASLVLLLSLAGLPPFAGFYAKYFIFRELISSGHLGLAVFGVLASLVGVYFYLRLPVVLFMDKPPQGLEFTQDHHASSPYFWSSASVLLAVVAIIALSLWPQWLLDHIAIPTVEHPFRLIEPFITGN